MRLGQLRCGRPARSVTAAVPSTPTHCFGVRMATREITELQRIFQSRLDTLDHILDVGGKHLDLEAALHERLAPDMLPLGSQVALACNQPRSEEHTSELQSLMRSSYAVLCLKQN